MVFTVVLILMVAAVLLGLALSVKYRKENRDGEQEENK